MEAVLQKNKQKQEEQEMDPDEELALIKKHEKQYERESYEDSDGSKSEELPPE